MKNSMFKVKLIATIVLVALVGIVVLQNTEAVETKVLFMSLTMPRAALLASTWIIGVLCGLLIPRIRKHKKK